MVQKLWIYLLRLLTYDFFKCKIVFNLENKNIFLDVLNKMA